MSEQQPPEPDAPAGDVPLIEAFPVPQRRSIPPVADEDVELAQRIRAMCWLGDEVVMYLPTRRLNWDRLSEFADMLESLAPDIRALVERMFIASETSPEDK